MPDRPEPTVLPGGDVIVPGSDAALLLGVLRLYEGECRGVRRPAASARPRMLPELRSLLVAAEVAARRDAARRAVAVVREVPVAHAAVMLRVTPGRVRQLLASGALAGRRGPGRMWLVDEASIDRRMHG
ncbi:MAG: hypothetical protein ACRDPY_16270 [Streptosporangiaceae bacterium]